MSRGSHSSASSGVVRSAGTRRVGHRDRAAVAGLGLPERHERSRPARRARPGRGSVQGSEWSAVRDGERPSACARRGGTRPRRCGCRSGRACAGPAGSRSPGGPSSIASPPAISPTRERALARPSRRPRARAPRPAAGPARRRCSRASGGAWFSTSCVGACAREGSTTAMPPTTVPARLTAATDDRSSRLRTRPCATRRREESDSGIQRDVHSGRRHRARSSPTRRAACSRRPASSSSGTGRTPGADVYEQEGTPAARPRARVDPAEQGRDQGADHDAGRVGIPLRQRRAAQGARPLRLPAARARPTRACAPASPRPTS